MVAQHYRWDFYGLSTDSKPTATDPKVANGSTYYEANTSKLYVWYNDQWYEKIDPNAGSTVPMVVLTATEYEELSTKDPDTLYIITADPEPAEAEE